MGAAFEETAEMIGDFGEEYEDAMEETMKEFDY